MPELLSLDELSRKARSLPLKPGVYMFYNSDGKVIYVGKSKALRNRVSSYLTAIGRHPPKTARLVRDAVNFDTIVTTGETEALILENELIKKYRPKYNILLKDDKSYPYLKLSVSDQYPRLSVERSKSRKKGDKGLYFGPYSSGSAVYAIIDAANSIFGLPSCKKKFPRDIGASRPCLYYHMGKCMGVCTGNVSKEQYASTVEKLIAFLKNDYRSVIAQLKSEMNACAEALEFEKAASIRNSIRALEKLKEHQNIVGDLSFEADVFGFFGESGGSCVSVMLVRSGRLIDVISYHLGADSIIGESDLDGEDRISDIITAFYSGRTDIPRNILLSKSLIPDGKLTDSERSASEEYLSSRAGRKVSVSRPERGENKRLTDIADENAKEAFLHRRELYKKDESLLIELASLLGLEVVPEVIEAIDISNNGSDEIVAGIITVEDGRYSKKDYRSFNIDKTSPDDYASMSEALRRRFERAVTDSESEHWKRLPDLLLLDGGVGHVSTVKKLLGELGLSIPVFGMVKDDYHKTRCLTDGENEISIARNQRIFNFIYGIQEEVHRYTFGRMDRKRRKKVKTSLLESISGIGPKKAASLLKHFGTLANISKASKDELSEANGISSENAHEIYRHFHKE